MNEKIISLDNWKGMRMDPFSKAHPLQKDDENLKVEDKILFEPK